MSSSTSSSEHRTAGPATAARWGGFLRSFAITAAAALAGVLALAFLLDPYDTGRTPLTFNDGVRPQGPRTAAASRGRDPAFRAAIFGNSHIQLISPDRLTQATGVPFVSLIAPGSRPREALVLIDWFLRHHPAKDSAKDLAKSPTKNPAEAEALVIGIDDYWCTGDPALPDALPFPYWLYTDNLRDYLVGLVRFDVIEEIQRRIADILARQPERARPDGYWDYEPSYASQGYDVDPAIRAKLDGPGEALTRNLTGRFPAAERLAARLAAAPAGLRVILVRPPVYRTALPAHGTAEAATDAACRAAFASLAADRRHTALVDWRRDRPELRDPNQFFDHSHYRQPIARLVEADIAAALATLR